MQISLMSSVSFMALGLLAGTAFAQTAPSTPIPATQAAVAEPPPAALGEIVVTAQRRSESLQHAAIAVSAVSGSALQSAGVTQPKELTSLVPSLQIATSAGPYSIFYLRGVGNFNGNALSDAAVAFNVDGVYFARPSSTTGFFYDLDRVEVLKGPQGTLYGRNATGGAINVITHKPDLDKFEADASIEYGNYDSIRADADVNIPINDISALRLAGDYVRHDGYLSDGTDDEKDYGGRAEYRINPSEKLKILVSADYFNQGGKGAGATIAALGLDNRIGLNDPRASAYYESQFIPLAGRNLEPLNTSPYLDNYYWGLSATIDYTTPIGVLTVIPAYREGHLNFVTDAPGFSIAQKEADWQTSLEVRLTSSDEKKLRYIFGVYYFDEGNDVPEYRINQEYSVGFQNYDQRTKSEAVFGRLTYAMTDNFRLSAGLRYTNEEKTFSGTYDAASEVCVVPTGCPAASPFPFGASMPAGPYYVPGAAGTLLVPTFIIDNSKKQFDKITYRLAADWDVTSTNLLYASYETGFKSGGFYLSSDTDTFRPETIKAYTLGSKNRFFENRVTLNAELFYWDYKDQQISHLSQDSSGDIIFQTENVGAATFKGVELEGQFLPVRNTLFGVDIQYLDASYDQFTYTIPTNTGAPITGCTVSPVVTTVYTLNCSGKRPPNAPALTVNASAQQTFPLSNDGKITVAARAHYQSKALTGLEFLSDEYQSPYVTGDLQVTYVAPQNRYSITGFVNNVSNATILAETFPVPLASFRAAELRDPRTYGVRFGVHF